LGIDSDSLDYLKKLQLIRAFLTNIPPVFIQLFFDGKSPKYRQSGTSDVCNCCLAVVFYYISVPCFLMYTATTIAGFANKIEESLSIFLKPQNPIREVPVPSSMQMVSLIYYKISKVFESHLKSWT